ncbi:hypothetical protein CIPAW_14G069700 [Carya illinoinensis]|uniref:Uncharacterized protein n=1 Tax=Carya illinoinensis TaxID=32201 RepID=A0A8T1NK05_CARIL|nr:hypothetical protein CIPAW_14G069700 [Carya illinoinensis]
MKNKEKWNRGMLSSHFFIHSQVLINLSVVVSQLHICMHKWDKYNDHFGFRWDENRVRKTQKQHLDANRERVSNKNPKTQTHEKREHTSANLIDLGATVGERERG